MGLLLALAVGIVAATAMHFGLFRSLELGTTDSLFKAAYTSALAEPDTSHVTIIAIDEKTMSQPGKMSDWPRFHHAVVTRQLLEAGARVIAFELLFSEDAEGDDEFPTEIASASNVVLPVVETSSLDGAPGPGTGGTIATFETPLPSLAQEAVAVSHVNVFPDSDGDESLAIPCVRDEHVTLPAVPDGGYHFNEWSGDDRELVFAKTLQGNAIIMDDDYKMETHYDND